MSNFRDKAAAIKAEGEAQRGEFNPQGAPLRAYNYWLQNSGSDKAKAIRYGTRKENFCHFWRVVAIWAPLFWLGEKFVSVIESDWFKPAFIAFAIIAVVAAVLVGGGLPGLMFLFAVLAGIAALLAFGVAVAYWAERYPVFSKKVFTWLGLAFITSVVLMLLGLFIGATGWFGVVIIAIAGIVGAVVYKNMENLGDWIEGLRIRNERAEDARKAKRLAELQAFYDEHGYYPNQAPAKEPSRVSKFFRGIGDFIIMWGQVIRVNKWKICPIVPIAVTPVEDDFPW